MHNGSDNDNIIRLDKKCQPTTVYPILTNDINIDTIILCQH